MASPSLAVPATPSASPSSSPSASPSSAPTSSPSASPSALPSASPSESPSVTEEPSNEPSEEPTIATRQIICNNVDIEDEILECLDDADDCDDCDFVALPASADTCSELNDWFCKLSCCDECNIDYTNALACAESIIDSIDEEECSRECVRPLDCPEDAPNIQSRIEDCIENAGDACEECSFVSLLQSQTECIDLNEWFCELNCCNACADLYGEAMFCAEDLNDLDGCDTDCFTIIECDDRDLGEELEMCVADNEDSCPDCEFLDLPRFADTCDDLNEWFCDLSCCDACSELYEDAFQCAEVLNGLDEEECSRTCVDTSPGANQVHRRATNQAYRHPIHRLHDHP